MYLTGDIHGDVRMIEKAAAETACGDEMIITVLGDAGVNFYLDERDEELKRRLQHAVESRKDCTVRILFVRGNHDCRPERTGSYRETERYGGRCYVEDRFPGLIFLKDGERYLIEDRTYIVAGGGFSEDYFNRLLNGYPVWEDEELSHDEYLLADKNTAGSGKCIILSHMMPPEVSRRISMGKGEDSLTARYLGMLMDDHSDVIEGWYAGHYHLDTAVDDRGIPFRVLYRDMICI